ncbi:hypothetical protein BDZ85DRAFT_259749 [Elsinoe ampelina]|uniref:Uncharacterized protein n=1 Tax=Elsinoe ampelina TaxID=302913 RepID=A0A6A6GI54_9PEZI|nr:hypothetical protein BDZ85DRAFT_259749 [Elsinoe ampelina]
MEEKRVYGGREGCARGTGVMPRSQRGRTPPVSMPDEDASKGSSAAREFLGHAESARAVHGDRAV